MKGVRLLNKTLRGASPDMIASSSFSASECFLTGMMTQIMMISEMKINDVHIPIHSLAIHRTKDSSSDGETKMLPKSMTPKSGVTSKSSRTTTSVTSSVAKKKKMCRKHHLRDQHPCISTSHTGR